MLSLISLLVTILPLLIFFCFDTPWLRFDDNILHRWNVFSFYCKTTINKRNATVKNGRRDWERDKMSRLYLKAGIFSKLI